MVDVCVDVDLQQVARVGVATVMERSCQVRAI
jgi:hypothetical protein